jgi:hypothetical protein
MFRGSWLSNLEQRFISKAGRRKKRHLETVIERLETRCVLVVGGKSGVVSEALTSLFGVFAAGTTPAPETRPAREAIRQQFASFYIENSTDIDSPVNSTVLVSITGTDIESIQGRLEAQGFVTVGARPDLYRIDGWLPIVAFPEVERLLEATGGGLRPVARPMTSAGLVENQADIVHESARVRGQTAYPFDGSGVRVGVLSDSYNALGGAAADVASGDLPDGVVVLEDLSGAGLIDEGRAMLQLVHDMAPGASLAFATAFTGQLGFANNIRALARTANADVIVDDVSYLDEPFFQDGIIAQAVDEVASVDGVSYFSSAGNDASRAYETTSITFSADTVSSVNISAYDFDFGAGVDTRQRINVSVGGTVRIALQWDDPFYTVNGVDTNLDLILVNAATGAVVAVAQDDNVATQVPSEFLGYINSTGQTTFDVMIRHRAGPVPGRFKYIDGSRGAVTIAEFATNSGTVNGHSSTDFGIAVAAAPYFNQLVPESFTSTGPINILFDDAGNRLATPVVRPGALITAIDGTNTTFFGSDFEGDGFPNFFGTSAAAPHAAAIAALMIDARPGITPTQIRDRLIATAQDIHTPGFDNTTGHGLVNAFDAIFGQAGAVRPGHFEDFERIAGLGWEWETTASSAQRVAVRTDATTAFQGTNVLALDASFGFGDGLAEAILHVDARNFQNVTVSFAQREFGDEDQPMPASFTGSSNSDGVAFSVDGVNWNRLISLTGSDSTSTYQPRSFNLSQLAVSLGLTLGSNVRIKFQQYDNSPIPSDGMTFDNIAVNGTPVSGVDPLIEELATKARRSQVLGTGNDLVDGTISKHEWQSAYPNWYFDVDPFFGHIAAMGLLEAHRHQVANGGSANEAQLNLDAVRLWLEWCAKRTNLSDLQRRDLSGVDGLADRRVFFGLRSQSPFSQVGFVASDGIESTSGYFLLLLSRYIEVAGTGALTSDLRQTAKDAVDAMGLVRDPADGLFRPKNRTVNPDSYANAQPFTFRYMQNNQDAVQGLMAAQTLFGAVGDTAYAQQSRDWATIAHRSFFRFIPVGQSVYANISELINGVYSTQHSSIAVWYTGGSGLTNIQMVASGEVADRLALFNSVDAIHNPVFNGDIGADGVSWSLSNAGIERWVFATAELGNTALHGYYLDLLRTTVSQPAWGLTNPYNSLDTASYVRVYSFRIGLALMALANAKNALPDMVNAPPTFTLSTNTTTLPENSSTATRIKMADLSVVDDLLGSVTWTLSGPQAAAFEVDSGSLYLRAGSTLDFEAATSVAVTVQADDPSTGGSIDDMKVFTITVTNVNESPTALALSNTSIAENVSTGLGIGTFTSTDPDALNTFTYSLVSGTGSTDNASFAIVSNELRTNTPLDFETKSSYAIRVRTTDQGGLSFERQFTITVSDANEPVSAPQIVSLSVAENSPNGTVAGAVPSGNYLFFSDEDTDSIRRSRLDGSDVVTIVSGLDRPRGVFVDETFAKVYWADATGPMARFQRANFDGSSVETVASVSAATTTLNTFAVDIAGGVLYYSNSTAGRIERISLDGSNQTTLVSGLVAPVGITFDATAGKLYWADQTAVRRANLDGSSIEVVVATGGRDVEIDTSRGVLVVATLDNRVLQTNLDGSAPVTLATTGGEISQLGLDRARGRAYWTDLQQDRMFRIDLAGFAPVASTTPVAVITSGLSLPRDVAIAGGASAAFDPDLGQVPTFSIVGGTFSGSFAISPLFGQITSNATAVNFESAAIGTLIVRTTDPNAPTSFRDTVVVVTVTNVNEAPTALSLSSAGVAENVAVGTVVGAFSSTDPDTVSTFTNTLVPGTGSDDNGAFQIVANELRTNTPLDFETKSSYAIRVRTTDQGGLSFERTFVIAVTDIHEAPTALSLSSTEVAENVATGTGIGTFASTDPDAANTFTYSLVSGTGSTDNGSFTIVGNELRTNTTLDFETKSSYSIRVRTADQTGLSFERQFTISVADVNEVVTALSLSSTGVAENVAGGSVIGAFSSTDPDAGNSFLYDFVTGTGATDNEAFTIVGNELRTNVPLDLEAKSSYSIRVRTTDQGGLTFEQTFTITVTNVNETPTALLLSTNTIAENVATGTGIGVFTTTDPDAANTFSYSLVSGTGSTDNASFTIVGNGLRTNAALNFETKSSFSIRVRTTDQGGLSFEQAFTITVTNVNESPTALNLSSTNIAENVATGTSIGTLASADPDTGNTFTYSLVSGTGATDNASFTIVSNELRTNTTLDFETKASYSIRVRTTDQGGLSFEQTFTITVTNVNETPTALLLSTNTIAENVATGTGIGVFTTTDPDAANTFSYSLVSGTGSTDNASFTIVSNELRTNTPLDFETKSSYSIRVRTADQGGLTFDRMFTITVIDVAENQAPALDASGSPFAFLGVGSRQSREMLQGTLVSDILARGANGNPITDTDAGAQKGIAITAVDGTLGTIQYTLVTTNPQESDWKNVVADGAVSNASALLLPTTARLRFTTSLLPHHATGAPFLPLESKLDTGLTFRAWDQTSGTVGARGDTTTNGGGSAFSAATETAKVYFEARLFRIFNTVAGLNIYALEAEFNALTANPALVDRSTSAFTGFTILMSAVPELGTVPLFRLYFGVQYNDDGTQTDMGYRYLTSSAGEASILEGLGRADLRPARQGAYFREVGDPANPGDKGVNNGTAVLGYIYATQQTGTAQMTQVYRTDTVGKPTRPAGTVEGGTPTSTKPQEQGDHVYTTNTAFETGRPGTWRVEAARGFVRELTPSPTGVGPVPLAFPVTSSENGSAKVQPGVATPIAVTATVEPSQPLPSTVALGLIAIPTTSLATSLPVSTAKAPDKVAGRSVATSCETSQDAEWSDRFFSDAILVADCLLSV